MCEGATGERQQMAKNGMRMKDGNEEPEGILANKKGCVHLFFQPISEDATWGSEVGA